MPAAAPVCDKAIFVEHVIVDAPVLEGTLVMPGMHFTKTWQVTNAGTCDWTSDYKLVHTGGDAFGASAEIELPSVIAPGETVDLAISMTVPDAAGAVASEWMLQNAEGELFGTGPAGDRPLTVEVNIAELLAGVSYDFATVACLARWDSGRAEFLPCDDSSDTQVGYITLPQNGTIEVKPNNQGWIAGYFPLVSIQEGDHFRATVGCVDEQDDCNVAFILKVSADGEEFIVGDPLVAEGDQAMGFDVNLSPLAGQQVSLILYMEENGGRSQSNLGYWRNARIEN